MKCIYDKKELHQNAAAPFGDGRKIAQIPYFCGLGFFYIPFLLPVFSIQTPEEYRLCYMVFLNGFAAF